MRTISVCAGALAVFAGPVALAQAAHGPFTGTMTQCESIGGCTSWDFHDNHASARWSNNIIGDLTVEQFGDTVKIRRVDTAGAGAGFQGLYTGVRHGTRIDGTVSWTWPGHPPGSIAWAASIDPTGGRAPAPESPLSSSVPWSKAPLVVLKECEGGGDNCKGTWSLHGARGSAVWEGGPHAILVVTELTAESIALRRLDFRGNTPGLRAVYKGTITGPRISGSVTWTNKNSDGSAHESTGKWSATVESGSLRNISAERGIPVNMNTISGRYNQEQNTYRFSTGGNHDPTPARATLVIARLNDYFAEVTNHTASPLTAYTILIATYGSGVYNHLYDSTDMRHFAAKPGNAIVEPLQQGVVGGSLLAAIFADGETYGDPDEVTILECKLEAKRQEQNH
jgi:hypothetical protein